MNLHLVDLDSNLKRAWKKAFSDTPEVKIYRTNIFNVAFNTIVSPANSYGNMNGGIDKLYAHHFGPKLQRNLKAEIAKLENKMLPVGEALLIPTFDSNIPYLISAPTMVKPGMVKLENCYLAMAAILSVVDQHKNLCTDVFCPGLATGTGNVPVTQAAEQMKLAYSRWKSAQTSSS